MSWGTKLLGFANLIDELGEIQTQLTGSGVVVVGTNVEYAAYVEFGTGKHVDVPERFEDVAAQFKGDNPAPGGGIAPQPYLVPAMREAERKIPQIAGDARSMEDAVMKVALFIERRASQLAPVGDSGNLQGSIRAVKL